MFENPWVIALVSGIITTIVGGIILRVLDLDVPYDGALGFMFMGIILVKGVKGGTVTYFCPSK